MFKILYSTNIGQYKYITDCYSVCYTNHKYTQEKLLYDYIHPCWRLQLLYNELEVPITFTKLAKIHDTDEYMYYKFNTVIRRQDYVLNNWYLNIFPSKLGNIDGKVDKLRTSKAGNYPLSTRDNFTAEKVCSSLVLIDNKILEHCVPEFTSGRYIYRNRTIHYDTPLAQ